MKNEKENLEINTLSDGLLKEVSGGMGARLEIRPGMSPEIRAAAQEANSLLAKMEAMQMAYRADKITFWEYRAQSDEIQEALERIKLRMRY